MGGGSPSSRPPPNATSGGTDDEVEFCAGFGDNVASRSDDVESPGDDEVGADNDDEVLVGGDDVGAEDAEVGTDDDDSNLLVNGDDVVARDDEVGARGRRQRFCGQRLTDQHFVVVGPNLSSPTSNVSIADDDFPYNDVRSDYPEWSWDRVRTYVAILRSDDYSDEQILALAAQDVVMLEKYNGHETHGSVEMGTLVAARRIKAVNTKVKILLYLNCMVHYRVGGEHFKDEWALPNPKRNNTRYKRRD